MPSSRLRILYGTLFALAGLLVLGWFASFYRVDTGFTSLLTIGDRLQTNLHPALLGLNPYLEQDSHGYDAQHYVQIAVADDLADPALAKGVDNLPYRARRILFSRLVHVLGFGDPATIVTLYCLLNLTCFVGLGLLLLRWFPPVSLKNTIAWLGVMLSSGMIWSIRNSLLDGPSLLLIALGMSWIESGKPLRAAVLLGLSGLGKDTNILAATAFAPGDRPWTPRTLATAALRGSLVVLPLFAWSTYLWILFKPGQVAGSRNFAPPFTGYYRKWLEVIPSFDGTRVPDWVSAVNQVSFATIVVWFVVQRDWKSIWWRLGASYTVLLAFLGDAVWEGTPGAATRVLLPLVLAFNVTCVASKRRIWIWLILGNLPLLVSIQSLNTLRKVEDHDLMGRADIAQGPPGKRWSLNYGSEWHGSEHSTLEYWRWARNRRATVLITNPYPVVVETSLRFSIRGFKPCTVLFSAPGEPGRSLTLNDKTNDAYAVPTRLAPGENTVVFEVTDQPDSHFQPAIRPSFFCVRNLKMEFLSLAQTP